MATITITEILGGDNIAGSRITINDNFKRVSNAINTIETRLDTSFSPGGSLNVGSALVKKYTNPTSAQVFTCEATGLFQGNLNVLLNSNVTQSVDVGLDLSAHRNVTFNGSATGGPHAVTTSIRSIVSNETVNSQLYAPTASSAIVDPQALTGTGVTRTLTSVIGYSVLRINATTYTGAGTSNCTTLVLPTVGGGGCTPGQILTVIIDGLATGTAMTGGFKLDSTPFAPGYNNNIAIGAVTATNTTAIRKLSITLFADTLGWRVLSVAQPPSVSDITY